MDCENCRHLTVVGLHDAGPWVRFPLASWVLFQASDSKTSTPVLPCQVPVVLGSDLGLGEIESLICKFYLSVAARTPFGTDPSLALHIALATNQQANKPQPIEFPLKVHTNRINRLMGCLIISRLFHTYSKFNQKLKKNKNKNKKTEGTHTPMITKSNAIKINNSKKQTQSNNPPHHSSAGFQHELSALQCG